MGFFSESTLIDAPVSSTIAKCGLCKLDKSCHTPRMKVYGKGKRQILIVGEAPGQNEDERGRPFIGKSGEFLKLHLRRLGIERDKDCWLTNALICRPPKNATPSDDQITYCNPNLQNTIRELQPHVIIALGAAATRAATLNAWNERAEAFGRWTGWTIPDRTHNTWICPVYHPSFVQRELEQAKGGTPIEFIFSRDLKQAIKKAKSKPYAGQIPNLEDQIEVLFDDSKIIKALNKFARRGGIAATDFETNMLKPDAPTSRIVAASVCWEGKQTIAFPFHSRKVRIAYREVLKHCKIVGHNIKFEQRWIWEEGNPNRVYKNGPRMPLNVVAFDTMNVAHLCDNRQKVCSLAFQAYVHFGVPSYYDHISPFLSAKDSYDTNKIHQIEPSQLLLYNGIDSLLCYMLAMKQCKQLGISIK